MEPMKDPVNNRKVNNFPAPPQKKLDSSVLFSNKNEPNVPD